MHASSLARKALAAARFAPDASSVSDAPYDAVLLVSFGGPERPEDVMPFLENVVRGKNVPRSRLEAVAEHYQHLGGKSPINDQCRTLIAALKEELAKNGPDLPVYWGNRNWHPFLADTLRTMRDDGVKRALAFVTSAYSSYSSCRQYLENIEAARAEVGEGAPVVDKLRAFYNHPGFIEAMTERVAAARARVPKDRWSEVRIAFTAHSIPVSMADGCDYVAQLTEACELVAGAVGHSEWQLVFQSRSGPPQVPWLEPDILDHLEALSAIGERYVIAVPIGFVSDHVEVVWDLDHEAKERAEELGLSFVRAKTAGSHPRFIQMIRELILERTEDASRLTVGRRGPNHDVCPPDCCKIVKRPA